MNTFKVSPGSRAAIIFCRMSGSSPNGATRFVINLLRAKQADKTFISDFKREIADILEGGYTAEVSSALIDAVILGLHEGQPVG